MTVPKRSDETVEGTTDLVFAIAAAKNVEADALTTRLHDVIDTDALERVLQSADHRTTITFAYEDLRIEVSGDGAFEITDGPQTE